MQLPLRVGGRLHCGPADGEVHLQRGPLGTGLGLGQMPAGQCVPGAALGVDRIGLGAATPLGAHRAVQFDNQFALLGQVPGEPGAVAAAALQSPGPKARVVRGEARGANVLVGMSEAVAKPDATSVWLAAPDGSKVPAVVNVNATTNTVIVNPDADLAAGTTYQVVLTDGVKDLAGNKLVPTTWTFTTSGTASGDTVPPTVSGQSPAPGATGVAKGANVLVGMSEPVVKPDSSSVWLEAPDGARILAAVNYNATSNTVIVNPDGDLVAGTTATDRHHSTDEPTTPPSQSRAARSQRLHSMGDGSRPRCRPAATV